MFHCLIHEYTLKTSIRRRSVDNVDADGCLPAQIQRAILRRSSQFLRDFHHGSKIANGHRFQKRICNHFSRASRNFSFGKTISNKRLPNSSSSSSTFSNISTFCISRTQNGALTTGAFPPHNEERIGPAGANSTVVSMLACFDAPTKISSVLQY